MSDSPASATVETAAPAWWVTWGRLLRLPNLFTVPGDAAAGFLLVSGGAIDRRLLVAGLVVLLLYVAGLLLNDYFDRREDAAERPDRPIPSGHANAGAVLLVGLLTIALALVLAFALLGTAAGVIAGALALLVLLYDAGLRRVGPLGPLLLGLCRAASVYLGATAAAETFMRGPLPLLATGTAFAYTLALSVVAARETECDSAGRKAFAPALMLLVASGLAALLLFRDGTDWLMPVVGAGLLLLAAFRAAKDARAHLQGAFPVPPLVGRFVRNMLAVQMSWVVVALLWKDAAYAIAGAAVFLILMWAAGAAGKRFYGS